MSRGISEPERDERCRHRHGRPVEDPAQVLRDVEKGASGCRVETLRVERQPRPEPPLHHAGDDPAEHAPEEDVPVGLGQQSRHQATEDGQRESSECRGPRIDLRICRVAESQSMIS